MNKPIPDQVQKLACGSIIQHGPYNDRIYLMKPGKEAPQSLPRDLIELATQYGYSKIFTKVPSGFAKSFANAGYVEEAAIPGFYFGSVKGVFMSYYLKPWRSKANDSEALDQTLKLALNKSKDTIRSLDQDRFNLRQCEERDAEKMASIYQIVFPTYPFPIQDPQFLIKNMQNHVDYFCVESEGELIALSSAEMDPIAQNVEMTDFATLPQCRGSSLGIHLLARMEDQMKRKGMRTAFTIARAVSPGMNITFAKLGYAYGGRLINNTNISGNIECMNIWYKSME